MAGSQQHPTTWSSSKGRTSRVSSETPPPAEHVSFNQAQVGQVYGKVKVISPERRYLRGWGQCMVLTQCMSCGRSQWTNLSNLRQGKSRGCQRCSQPRQIPKWLDRRLTAAKGRCENPSNPQYDNYGGRGITFDFPSVLAAGLWIIDHLGLPDRSLELDRKNNDLGYAPGNLRWATHSDNNRNKRITVLREWIPEDWPYAQTTVLRKLSCGMTRQEVIRDAETAVSERRKNWKAIKAWLDAHPECTTSSTPGRDTGSRCRVSSSTTAVTEAASTR